MIELSNEWVMYKTKDGEYRGYFEEGNQPDGWVADNTYYVTCKQFLDHFYLVDASVNLAASITYDHFTDKADSIGMDVEFEDIKISKSDAVSWTIAALEDDKHRYVDSYGENYEDWQNFEGILGVLTQSSDFCVIVGDNENSEIVDAIYSALGLTNDNDIYEYELKELSLDGLEKLRDSLI